MKDRKSADQKSARPLRIILWSSLALIIIIIGIIAVRTALMPTGVEGEAVKPDIVERLQAIDEHHVARRISQAVQFPTVIYDYGPADSTAFLQLHDWLEETYPAAHQVMERKVVNNLSLLYRWPGQSDCPAIGFVSHLDVVPVEEDTEADWTYPPFEGVVADGFVWGRGAIDTKDNMIVAMEAVERLASRGFKPACDLYLLFGHDEETGGEKGAAVMARELKKRGVRFAWLLDEGGGLGADWSGRRDPPQARVGVSHQGYATLKLTAKAEGGHSASGVENTAITQLTAALTAIAESPMPGGLVGVAKEGIVRQAAGGPLHHRIMAANLWLFEPFAEYMMEARPGTRGQIRTFMAPTVIEGGVKANVLPQHASALVNARLHFRDTPEDVLDHVRKITAPFDVEVELYDVHFSASTPTSSESAAFRELESVLREVHGPMRVVPVFITGATDSRYFTDITESLFNHEGYLKGKNASRGAHDTDERLSTKYLPHAVLMHELLIERHGNPD
ncbi:MAG: M20/M25/M40 family metallo-hydrolase [Candidatus Cyclobacteriaceae bacterium M2_1C_046]